MDTILKCNARLEFVVETVFLVDSVVEGFDVAWERDEFGSDPGFWSLLRLPTFSSAFKFFFSLGQARFGSFSAPISVNLSGLHFRVW